MKFVKGFVDGVLIEIYERATKDDIASEKSDVPVYVTSVFIKKKIPNSRDIYDQPISEQDKQKYTALMEAFNKGESAPVSGTPLDQWPAMDVARIEYWKARSVFTVQSLAQLPESNMKPGEMTDKTKAQKWLAAGSENTQLREENDALKKRIEALEAMAHAPDPVKRGPGRPRKVVSNEEAA